MKKHIGWILIFLCCLSFSEASPQSHLAWTLQNSSWFYEPLYMMSNISLDTSLIYGLKFDWFTIGTDIFCEYVSMNGQDPLRIFQGAWMNLGGTISTCFDLSSWMEIKLGAGGLWQKSSFQYNNSGWLGLDLSAVSLLFDTQFSVLPFMEIILRNRFDLMLTSDDDGALNGVLPNYTGGLRLLLTPISKIPWLCAFAEGTALYWNYSSKVRTLDTWMFQVQIGVSLDFWSGDFDKSGQQKKADTPENTVNKYLNPQGTAGKEKAEMPVQRLNAFKRLNPGEKAAFTEIVFEDGKNTLMPESMPVLDGIADFLKSNTNLKVAISAYTEYYGDIAKEFELIKSRAKTIMAYLVNQGVAEDRIKIMATGQVIKDDNSIKSKVVFTISAE